MKTFKFLISFIVSFLKFLKVLGPSLRDQGYSYKLIRVYFVRPDETFNSFNSFSFVTKNVGYSKYFAKKKYKNINTIFVYSSLVDPKFVFLSKEKGRYYYFGPFVEIERKEKYSV